MQSIYSLAYSTRPELPLLHQVTSGLSIRPKPSLSRLILILIGFVGLIGAQTVSDLSTCYFYGPEGMPVTINGQVYALPATVQLEKGKTARFAAQVFDRGDGRRFRPTSWLVAWSFIFESYGAVQPLDYLVGNSVSVSLITITEVRGEAIAVGPGMVQVSPSRDGDGYYPDGALVRFTPVPNPGGYFAGWDPPVTNADTDGVFEVLLSEPKSFTARFAPKSIPPPTFQVDGTFPALRLRAEPMLLEGAVRVKSSPPTVIRKTGVTCTPEPLFVSTSISPNSTPLTANLRLGAENNFAREGLYSCALQLTSVEEQILSIPFTVRIGPEEVVTPPAVAANGASFVVMPLAPGSIFSLFGNDIGAAASLATQFPLPETLNGVGVRISVAGPPRNAQMFYVSPNQLNFLVPLDLLSGGGTLEIVKGAADTIAIPIQVEPLAPALFTANNGAPGPPAGYYMVVRGEQQHRGDLFTCPENGACIPLPIVSSDPAEEVFLILFGTGFRNGYATPPRVRLGDAEVEATFWGAHREFAGLDQINVKVPRALLGSGTREVSVEHGGKRTNTVMISF